MSEKMTREDVVRMARECDIHVSEGNTFADDCYISVLYRFANKVIEHFLATTGQYVTNDASREAAIQAAVEAEREAPSKKMDAIAQTCREENSDYAPFEYAAAIIRARGKK